MLGVKSNKQSSSYLGVKSNKSNNTYLGRKDAQIDNVNKSNITSSTPIYDNEYNQETTYVPTGLKSISVNKTKSSLEKRTK